MKQANDEYSTSSRNVACEYWFLPVIGMGRSYSMDISTWSLDFVKHYNTSWWCCVAVLIIHLTKFRPLCSHHVTIWSLNSSITATNQILVTHSNNHPSRTNQAERCRMLPMRTIFGQYSTQDLSGWSHIGPFKRLFTVTCCSLVKEGIAGTVWWWPCVYRLCNLLAASLENPCKG